MAMTQKEIYDVETPVIEAIRDGDRYAFGELMRRHHAWVRGVVFAVLGNQDGVDDVTQQVWTRVWLQIGKLKETSRWRPWIYRMARNTAIDAGREMTRRRQRTRLLAAEFDANAKVQAPGEELLSDDKHRTIMRAVQGLPAIYREPFVLRHVNGWSYKEMAGVMGLPEDTIETRLVRARRLLRATLKDKV